MLESHILEIVLLGFLYMWVVHFADIIAGLQLACVCLALLALISKKWM
jgi:hypothetical protein